MNYQVLLGLLLTIMPITELRAGLPIIIEYVTRNGLSIWPWFFLVISLNILVIFFIFFFLDFLHERFMYFNFYKRFMNNYLKKTRKKARKVNKRFAHMGFLALTLFVSIPLPGTGAWTGSIVAWLLGLDRWKSIFAIAIGVLVAGLIVLGVSFGFFNGIYS